MISNKSGSGRPGSWRRWICVMVTDTSVLLLTILLLTATSPSIGGRATVEEDNALNLTETVAAQRDSFEDYLIRHVATSSDNDDQVRTTTGEDSLVPNEEINEAGRPEQLLQYFKYVPRQHWSCCMLGMLAGNKGFHCQADFYALDIATRNTNRAQAARQPPAHGRDRARPSGHWGYEITRSFRRCVVQHADEFHNCCFAATVERLELRRAQTFLTDTVGSAQ